LGAEVEGVWEDGKVEGAWNELDRSRERGVGGGIICGWKIFGRGRRRRAWGRVFLACERIETGWLEDATGHFAQRSVNTWTS